MSTRREKIEEMLKDEPGDVFLRYGLAVEFDNEERYEDSLALFTELTKHTPPHVPSYFRAAQLLARLDRIEEARALLRDGIEAARLQNNSHAAAEMGEFLATLGSLGE